MTYIYSPAKNRRSGTSMQKMPWRGAIRRREAVRQIHPGYPWEGQFISREQVAAYVAGTEITCLLCGNVFKFLGPHIKRTHGITSPDYKQKFGIPQGVGLSSADFREAHSAAAIANDTAKHVMDTKPWLTRAVGPIREKPRWVHVENYQRLKRYDGPVTRRGGIPTYLEFDWHIETARTVQHCRMVSPPRGQASWSAFKKRRIHDENLNARYKEARREWPGTDNRLRRKEPK